MKQKDEMWMIIFIFSTFLLPSFTIFANNIFVRLIGFLWSAILVFLMVTKVWIETEKKENKEKIRKEINNIINNIETKPRQNRSQTRRKNLIKKLERLRDKNGNI